MLEDSKEAKKPVLLPYELEREIFELTARAFPSEAVKLSIVSKYVQEWVEAVIYETVILDFPASKADLFLSTFLSRPPSFFARTVKRLYISTIASFPQAREIIAACKGVTDLSCWADPLTSRENLVSAMDTDRVQRLSIKLNALWGTCSLRPTQQFTPKIFPNLSHLEIVNPTGPNSKVQIDWDGLLSLPKLTHLALGHLWMHYHLDLIPHLSRFLTQSPRLKVLLLISHDVHFLDALTSTLGLQRDHRVVVKEEFHSPMPLVDYWDAIRQGEVDFWGSTEKMMLQNARQLGVDIISTT